MHFQDKAIFLFCPFSPHYRGVNNVVPPLTALAAQAAWKEPCDDHPVLCSKLGNFFSKNGVLVCCPLSAAALCGDDGLFGAGHLEGGLALALVKFFEIKPPFEAPDFCFMGHELAQPVP